MPAPSDKNVFIGIDIGTSGCRVCAIDGQNNPVAELNCNLPAPERNGTAVQQNAMLWWEAVKNLLTKLAPQLTGYRPRSIAVDGTSGTLLLCDDNGIPLAPALMYNDARYTEQTAKIAAVAPRDSVARGAGSGLARLLYLYEALRDAHHALHQADWVAGQLCGRFDVSDENDSLKTGYDPVARQWPDWMRKLDFDPGLLPQVVEPGTPIGTIRKELAQQFNLPADVQIIAGTTDSIAAFLATGANRIGDAVTSLGSTLVLKVLSDKAIAAPEFGIYSHRLGDRWLVGGASNSGGAVLKQFFSQQQLNQMTSRLQPDRPTGLDYYPLPGVGERFPINDPQLHPRLAPRPADDVLFFQAILEGIAAIEHQGYRKLHELGAPYPKRLFTAGGGSRNPAWNQVRSRLLGLTLLPALRTEACYGAALLAKQGTETTGEQP